MRLERKVAVIVGAGQSPGEGIGNGRATALRFAQEGARILVVDRVIASAEETVAMATQGGECVPFAADVTKEETLAADNAAKANAADESDAVLAKRAELVQALLEPAPDIVTTAEAATPEEVEETPEAEEPGLHFAAGLAADGELKEVEETPEAEEPGLHFAAGPRR